MADHNDADLICTARQSNSRLSISQQPHLQLPAHSSALETDVNPSARAGLAYETSLQRVSSSMVCSHHLSARLVLTRCGISVAMAGLPPDTHTGSCLVVESLVGNPWRLSSCRAAAGRCPLSAHSSMPGSSAAHCTLSRITYPTDATGPQNPQIMYQCQLCGGRPHAHPCLRQLHLAVLLDACCAGVNKTQQTSCYRVAPTNVESV